jgi:hypothetical protein
MNPPIFTGVWGKCHIQGITVDEKNGYIYYSFTTKLVKARLDGTVVGCVDGLLGHLGCIAFNEQDGHAKKWTCRAGDRLCYRAGFYAAVSP